MSHKILEEPALFTALRRWLHSETAPGILLFLAAVAAMVVANSPLAGAYRAFLDVPIMIQVAHLVIAKPLLLWINDGLMAVFFFLVGLELKRELIEGELSSLRQAFLPVAAAIGGIVGPALIYAAMNAGDPVALRGWAIPSATDIAFALGVLALLGERVPRGLKIFLLTVAIVDDIGAILIIALFYSSAPGAVTVAVAAGAFGLLIVFNRTGVRNLSPYLLVGLVLWVAVLKSGVHATLAGVLLALTIPLRVAGSPEASPARKLEADLHAPVAFGVLPLFAFANAGVALGGMQLADLAHPVPLGITAGLFLGKQLGVMLVSAALVLTGLARLPSGTRWPAFYGAAVLTGIGFTMSLFIGSLAFKEEYAANLPVDERIGILLGSALATIAGYLILRLALRRSTRA
jgi:Na+:H+ antiporter, NhaA family